MTCPVPFYGGSLARMSLIDVIPSLLSLKPPVRMGEGNPLEPQVFHKPASLWFTLQNKQAFQTGRHRINLISSLSGQRPVANDPRLTIEPPFPGSVKGGRHSLDPVTLLGVPAANCLTAAKGTRKTQNVTFAVRLGNLMDR